MTVYFALYGQNRIILGTDRETGKEHFLQDLIPVKKTSNIIKAITNKDALALIRQMPEFFFLTQAAVSALRLELIKESASGSPFPMETKRTDKHNALLITLKDHTCRQIYTMPKAFWPTHLFSEGLAFLIDYSDAREVAISLDVLILNGPQYYLK